MKIKVQTRKLAAGCSKHCFKVVDSNHTYGKVKLTWFEEIFEKYKSPHNKTHITKVLMNCTPKVRQKKSNF
ncbi:lysyl-tRNA synthetase [Streptococcus pneumoniae]|uniref:lysyl-tRNA synthetase n=1 Tax=Streptococcus pneumoniae TaxID=1313 RepID=UPI000B59456D|nr:lysyl-tRNA synthetase [Streptococcus pneumoniae]